ncbi:sensor histidine kinase [Arthrobacter agilis]|uniref:sensor histidine kinase n=1 Tax=Arthrobacter agilis TaxID=37921 RepID=UPI000B35B31D|nr:histidine kinase [Arthrobacter agilis]OUM44222.1 two-component sensor histidine kinase [Arthrobacter agilis]PPB46597.1 two-component sensor histidine kinase [Arthrobacter agilis]TPV23744.1 sensor histidine kinase [Arthrobacter agilis]WDF32177.1 histidine kinase [Arthrobacter agilis]VDR32473.1 Sensor histidine kinase desK [Arthrobacter agilis]
MDIHLRIARWLRTHPGTIDLCLALAILVVFVLPFAAGGAQDYEIVLLVSTVLVSALAVRRSRPILSAGVIAGVSVLQLVTGVEPVPTQFVILITLYTLAAYAPRWASLGSLGLAIAGTAIGLVRYGENFGLTGDGSVLATVPLFLIVLFFAESLVLLAWTIGDLARSRRLTYQALEDRARRLEVERQQERDLAAADERSHIAREMHDIVAHSLSVIITQADGARYASVQRPELAVQTLGTIADTGRGSLREMRRLLGVLRGDEDASTRPLPTLDDVDALLHSVRSAGVRVSCRRLGSPRRELPLGAELTAYRVVQESLTNVLKHAGADTSTEVCLDYGQRGLTIMVDDDGRGAAPDPGTAGAGQGIIGMTERVRLYDGTVTAGPRSGGGYSVNAFIPYTQA